MKKLVLFSLTYLLVYIFLYILRFEGYDTQVSISVLYGGAALITILCGLLAIRAYGSGAAVKTIIFFIIGITSWFVGDTLWSFEKIVYQVTSFPSTADYFYLIGYIVIFLSIVFEILRSHINWKALDKKFIIIVSSFSFTLIFLFFYYSIYLAIDPSLGVWKNIVTTGYGVGDVIVIIANFLLLALVWEYRGGRMCNAWVLFCIGFILTLFADILYAMLTGDPHTGISVVEFVSDVLYVLGYLIWAAALYSLKEMVHSIQSKLRVNKK